MSAELIPPPHYPDRDDTVPTRDLVATVAAPTPVTPQGATHAQHPVFSDRAMARRDQNVTATTDPTPQGGSNRSLLDALRDRPRRISARELTGFEQTMRANLAAPIKIAIVQTRGEAGKTITTFGLGSALSVARGGGVAAFDNDEAPGDLADRLERSSPASIADLLAGSPWKNQVGLESVLQHQASGYIDVLAADPHGGSAITVEEFNAVMEVLTTYYRIVLIDSGNSTRAENWQAALDAADALVVPIKLRTDHIVPAGRLLRALRDAGVPLAGRVVLAQSCGRDDRHLKPAERDRILSELDLDQYPLIEIPTDRALDRGATLRWSELRPRTQAAYAHLGATVLSLAIKQN